MVSVGVFLQFLLNFGFSLLTSFLFLWFLYFSWIPSNLAFVSFTLTLGGDGGSFLFFELDLLPSGVFKSLSTLLQDTDQLMQNLPSCSFEVEARGVASFFSSETSSAFFSAIFG